MANNVANRSDNFRLYAEDISNFFSQAPQAVVETVGYIGKRTVVLFEDLTKITKSSEALKETMRGALELAKAINMFIPIYISKKFVDLTKSFADVVSAWKVGMSIQYIIQGKFIDDITLTKLSTMISQLFFLVARCATTAVWLIEQQLLSLATASAFVGQLPIFGQALLVVGASPVINTLFLLGMSFLLVDRMRALLKGGYASEADEALKAQEVRDSMLKALKDPDTGARVALPLPMTLAQHNALARSVAEKKEASLSIAKADCINLVTEASLMLLTFTPLITCMLGVLAATTNVAGCVWSKDPQNNLKVVKDTQGDLHIEVRA